MLKITDKCNCSGCSACYSICPKGAIEMVFDEEGFKYPQVNEDKCIDCGLCDRICPETEPFLRGGEATSKKFAVQNICDNDRMQSTAGGFFSIVADYVLENSGFVFAVGFDNLTVVHKIAKNLTELVEMRGSKYVQSDIGDTFNKVKKFLKEGLCLFVGTPCQVNAIEKFLSKDKFRENLITIDLLCLGVSSPALYEKWLHSLEEKYKDNVKSVYFRDKSYGYATANVRVCFEHGKYIEQTYDAKSLMKTFFAGYNMRPSCYECTFRCAERASDFTIGDFHQIGKIAPNMDDDKGTTCVWAHSEKAKLLMDELKNKMTSVVIEEEASKQLFKISKVKSIPDDRGQFFDDFCNMEYKAFVTKWAKNDLKGKVVNCVRVLVNRMPFRSFVFKTMKRIKTKSFEKRVNAINKNNERG